VIWTIVLVASWPELIEQPSFILDFHLSLFSFNFTTDLYIYFPTSNRMAIIGTLPFRFNDKETTTLQRLPDTSMPIKNIYISVQVLSDFF
jgi:hypothetical protein